MLPPALDGLRTRAPPIPGHHAPGSMSKITLRRMLPLERSYYTKNHSEWSGEILANVARGESAAIQSGNEMSKDGLESISVR